MAADRSITTHFRLTPKKQQAMARLLKGDRPADVARDLNVTDRTIRNWRHDFQNLFLDTSERWLKIVAAMTQKSLKVYEQYLQGKGDMTGGDLWAARDFLRSVGILQGDRPLVDQRQVHMHKTDIFVNRQPDEEFADKAPAQIKRLTRVLERSQGEG